MSASAARLASVPSRALLDALRKRLRHDRAQGSEFDKAWLLIPARDNRVLSGEPLYTGITRARRELHVAANADVIEAALARHAGRWSGLGWRLGQAAENDDSSVEAGPAAIWNETLRACLTYVVR